MNSALALSLPLFAACLTAPAVAQIRLTPPDSWVGSPLPAKLGHKGYERLSLRLTIASDGTISKCRWYEGNELGKFGRWACDQIMAARRYAPLPLNMKSASDWTDHIDYTASDSTVAVTHDDGGARLIAGSIRDEDYPAEAVRNGQQGVVFVGFVIGSDGKPRDCKPIVPSGSVILDNATCALMQARFRYTLPVAVDRTVSEVRARWLISWRLPK